MPWATGALVSLIFGLTLGTRRRRRKAAQHRRSEDALSPEDRTAIEAEFAQHAAAVSVQVSAFADVLAGDDPLLRARLRQIEAAGGWS